MFFWPAFIATPFIDPSTIGDGNDRRGPDRPHRAGDDGFDNAPTPSIVHQRVAHDCPDTVVALELVDFGVVVVVVVGVVVVVVVVGSLTELDPDEPDDEDPAVEVVVGAVVVGVVVATEDPVDEWAVVSEATSTPRPMALNVAAMPMVAVDRRTRASAWSRPRPVN